MWSALKAGRAFKKQNETKQKNQTLESSRGLCLVMWLHLSFRPHSPSVFKKEDLQGYLVSPAFAFITVGWHQSVAGVEQLSFLFPIIYVYRFDFLVFECEICYSGEVKSNYRVEENKGNKNVDLLHCFLSLHWFVLDRADRDSWRNNRCQYKG